MAQALHQAGDQMRDQGKDSYAQYVDMAAERVDQFATYLRDQDVSQMMEGVERFARRQPAVFLGSAFLLGVLAARFLKASSPASSGSYQGGMYRGQGYPGYSTGYYGSSYSPTYGRASGMGTGTGTTTGYATGTGTGTAGGQDFTGRTQWETGATGRSTAGQQTPGFSGGRQGSTSYPEMDTGRNTQGYKDTPGTPGRETSGTSGISGTGSSFSAERSDAESRRGTNAPE